MTLVVMLRHYEFLLGLLECRGGFVTFWPDTFLTKCCDIVQLIFPRTFHFGVATLVSMSQHTFVTRSFSKALILMSQPSLLHALVN